jgi:tetratricopeptide (TPR) repeat protein
VSNASELQEKGVKLFQQKEYEDAARAFQEAHDAYTAEGKPDLAAEMQVNLGLTRRALGEQDQALELMQSALAVFESLDDHKRRAMVLGNLGGVYVAIGDKEQAATCYRVAADIFDELGEKKLHGETMLAIANLQMSDRKIGAAAATYEVGLSELENLSASQKVMKGLLGFRNRLMGGGSTTAESESETDNTPQSE